jgi:thiosulfate dehydrogenase
MILSFFHASPLQGRSESRYTIATGGISSMNCRSGTLLASIALIIVGTGCSRGATPPNGLRYQLNGPLIPARLTMVTAWDFPKNPLADASLDDSKLSREIKWGYQIFTNTPQEAARFAPGKGSCNNCHLNGGQREKALPLVAVAGMFPEYNRRAGRLISLADRVVDCFLRSQNATGRLTVENDGQGATDVALQLPTPTSREVLAVSAYITWISSGEPVGKNPTWRGQNTIPAASLVPIEKLDRARGQNIYTERCSSCHGPDGQGVQIGTKKAGPLWGSDSWNDGAGAARVYTLAGIVRFSMPYLDPGSLSDEDAQHVAAFIDSQPRPAYPFKDQDYLTEKLPVDSVYYPRR